MFAKLADTHVMCIAALSDRVDMPIQAMQQSMNLHWGTVSKKLV